MHTGKVFVGGYELRKLKAVKNKTIRYTSKGAEKFVFDRMVREKADGWIKKGVFTDEIIWGGQQFIFPRLKKKDQEAFKKGMFLFGMVRKDARAFVKQYVIELPKRYGSIEYANDAALENATAKITGTDLNHAYWRIAYNLDVISEKTYTKGLKDNFKSVRLAALSTMGVKKRYQKIRKGVVTDEVKYVGGDEELAKAYTLIRYTCYKYMNQVKRLLGKDFICYKTDCIYYVDTRENRKIVRDFFKEQDLLMKQLV